MPQRRFGPGVLADLDPPRIGPPGPNSLADMDRGGPNPLADLDRGVQIRGGSKSAVTPGSLISRIDASFWCPLYLNAYVFRVEITRSSKCVDSSSNSR